MPLVRPAIRYALGLAWTICAVGILLPAGQAGQNRSITQPVYTTPQAARGQQLYKAQCAECHGNALEGTVGSPLVGDGFLSNWSARSLANLVDKIQKTMPFNSPSSLSRGQSIDLAAYILQAGKFPSGQNELSDAVLAQIVFPTVRNPITTVVA